MYWGMKKEPLLRDRWETLLTLQNNHAVILFE